MRQTVYSNLNFLLNTTLERGCRNISSVGKLSYGDLFIPITLFISESPHLTGSFKLRANGRNVGSCWPTMLFQQCCVRLHVASKALKCSNKTVNIRAMTSIILERDVHAEQNADQHFDAKVNARQVGPHFGQIPHCTEKCPSEYARGVGGFGID